MAPTIATEKPTWAIRRIRLRRAWAGGWSVGVAVTKTHPGPGAAVRRHPAAAPAAAPGWLARSTRRRAGPWPSQPAGSARPDDLVGWPRCCQGRYSRRRATGDAPPAAGAARDASPGVAAITPRRRWPVPDRSRQRGEVLQTGPARLHALAGS